MKPINMTISAFGPYKDIISIDFSLLGTNGIYLITGDTGAGKTTIFDAISYALYGEASGSYRESQMLRSKYADISTPTEVELEFSYHNSIYKVRRNPEYERPSKRGDGTTIQKADALLTLPDNRIINGIKDVNGYIQNLLGIDKNQFSQIAMIAQGDFMKLLISSTEERKKIFRKIFKTHYYSKFQDELKVQVSEKSSKLKEVQSNIEQYISQFTAPSGSLYEEQLDNLKDGLLPIDDISELANNLIEDDENTQSTFEQKKSILNQDLNKVTTQIERYKNYQNNLKLLTEKEIELSNFKNKLPSIKEEFEYKKARFDSIAKLDKEMFSIEKELPLYDELFEKEKEVQVLSLDISKYEQNVKNATSDIENTEREKEQLSSTLEDLKNTESIIATLISECETQNNTIDSLDSLSTLLTSYNESFMELGNVKQKYESAIILHSETADKYKNAYTLFLNQQAGILAQELKDNAPCPVCGSTTHPTPASIIDNSYTKEVVDKLKEDTDNTLSKAQELSKKSAELQGKLSSFKVEIGNSLSRLEKKLNKTNLSNMDFADISCFISAEHQLAKNKLSITENKLEIAEKNLLKKQEIESKLPRLEKEAKEQNDILGKNKENLAICQTKCDELSTQKSNIQSKLSFKSKAEADSKYENLAQEKNTIKSQYEDIQKQMNDAENNILKLTSSIDDLKFLCKDTEEIDGEELSLEREKITQEIKAIDNDLKKIYARITNNQKLISQISNDMDTLAELEKEFSYIKALSDTANGNISGKEKIMLETYIQMHYFDRVLARANTRFMQISGGQFELVRRKSANGKQSQSGLDLDVIDHYNGSVRDIKTLSGGESFKASLSLALGLSDEIQTTAGGIKIDTMFIDEGFGSLDENSLNSAINVLSELSDTNRLIGIISHVNELKQRIDKQIVVSKDKTEGSKVEIKIQ